MWWHCSDNCKSKVAAYSPSSPTESGGREGNEEEGGEGEQDELDESDELEDVCSPPSFEERHATARAFLAGRSVAGGRRVCVAALTRAELFFSLLLFFFS